MHGKSTWQLHGRVRAVNGRLDGRCAASYGSCTRPCNVSCTRPYTRPCNVSCARYTAAVRTAREHVSARENDPYTAVTAVPYTRPVHGRVCAVHTARLYHPCTWLCTGRLHGRLRPCTWRVHGPVHGTCTRPYTGRAHGRVHDTYTAAYTCLRVQGLCTRRVRTIYTAENDRLHGRTRPCNVSCIRPCTGRIGLCTRQCTGRVPGRFRPCTLAVYTAVFGRLHSAYTAV